MRLLIAFLALVLLVLFTLSNKQVVTIGLWPTDFTATTSLCWVVLFASAVFFLAGALMTWGTSLAMRVRARRAEEQVRQLQAQVRTLQARPVAEPRVSVTPPARMMPPAMDGAPTLQGRPMAALPRG